MVIYVPKRQACVINSLAKHTTHGLCTCAVSWMLVYSCYVTELVHNQLVIRGQEIIGMPYPRLFLRQIARCVNVSHSVGSSLVIQSHNHHWYEGAVWHGINAESNYFQWKVTAEDQDESNIHQILDFTRMINPTGSPQLFGWISSPQKTFIMIIECSVYD